MERLCGILQDLLDILVSLYMLTLMVVLPLYTTETGYRHIGTEKCMFFRSVSLTACKVILPLGAVWLLCRLVRRFLSGRREKAGRPVLSATDAFALVYLAAAVCSYLHSSFREKTQWGDAFYGALGWYLGLVTQLLFLAVYFMVSRLWQRRDWMIGLWMLALGAVTLLGYLNRFGVNPLRMEGASPQYISTIGNINWYCGYIVTGVSLLAYELWQEWGKAGKSEYIGQGLWSWESVWPLWSPRAAAAGLWRCWSWRECFTCCPSGTPGKCAVSGRDVSCCPACVCSPG